MGILLLLMSFLFAGFIAAESLSSETAWKALDKRADIPTIYTTTDDIPPVGDRSLKIPAVSRQRTPIIKIKLGNQKQNVGVLTGQKLFDEVHKCLKEMTARNVFECKAESSCRVGGIWYSTNGILARDGSLEVKITNCKLAPANLEVTEALLEQVAGTFKVSSEDQKNCYKPNIPEDAPKMCNIGNSVSIEIEDVNAKLEVSLAFSSKSTEGHFDCVAIKEATIRFWEDNVLQDLANAMSAPTWKHEIACISNEVTK